VNEVLVYGSLGTHGLRVPPLDGPSCYEYGLSLFEGADESGGYLGVDVAIKAHDMGEIA